MSLRGPVAAALADALLAGPPEPEAAVARCAAALGGAGGWLRPLVLELLERPGGHWHGNHRRELLAAIHASSHFALAWQSRPHPRPLRPCLERPAQAPPPEWLTAPPPDWPNTRAVADFLDLSPARLEAWLQSLRYRDGPAERRLRHYSYRWLEKRAGGFRLLEIPKPRLREAQRRVLRGLLDRVPPHPAAHGFRAGHSCLGHAREHAGQAVVIRLDLADFFLRVGAARVRAIFRELGYPDEVACLLADLCTHRTPRSELDPARLPGERPDGFRPDLPDRARFRAPHLPQGAPTSPALANLAAFGLDLRLQAAAASVGARYSRYADDLVFSGGDELRRAAGRFVPWVGGIALDEGFALNPRKTRLMGKGARQVVTGLVVNEKPNVPRAYYDRIKAILWNCARFGPETQSGEPLARFRDRLAGQVARVADIHPGHGARLKVLFAAIDWRAAEGRTKKDPL